MNTMSFVGNFGLRGTFLSCTMSGDILLRHLSVLKSNYPCVNITLPLGIILLYISIMHYQMSRDIFSFIDDSQDELSCNSPHLDMLRDSETCHSILSSSSILFTYLILFPALIFQSFLYWMKSAENSHSNFMIQS